MAGPYDPTTAADASRTVGDVTGQPVKQYVFDVRATTSTYEADGADEFIVKLNGRVIKRMDRHAAIRAGLLAADPT